MKHRSSHVQGAHGPRRADPAAPDALPSTSRAAVAVWLGVIVALVAAVAFSLSHRGRGTVVEPSPFRGNLELSPRPTGGASDALSPHSPPASPLPAALTPSEWELDFKTARARFNELRWFGDDTASLLREAQEAEQRLPGLVAQGHIDAGEALLLKADLLEVLEPDARRRSEQLIGWWSEHPLPRPPQHTKNFRHEEALKREASLVLEWLTQPSVDRDVRDLEEQLRQLWADYR